MRIKIVILIIGLFCGVALMAQTSSFYSTSAYITNSQSQITNHKSQITNHQSPKVTGSFSSISAANYAALNSEGGACYRANGPRKGRGDHKDDYIIGVNVERSPVGDTPWYLFLLLFLAYAGYKKRNSLQKRSH